jgi:hypothetical protein
MDSDPLLYDIKNPSKTRVLEFFEPETIIKIFKTATRPYRVGLKGAALKKVL